MYVYIVRGSEDGHIGVYGSKSRAVREAQAYCMNEWGSTDAVETNDYTHMISCTGNGVSADVERDIIRR